MLPISTLLAGTAFVVLAAVNVGLMLEASRPTCSGKLKSRLITFHRIGYVLSGCTLLELAEANGVQIPFGCRQGQCGTCATRLLRGSVHMDTEIGLTAEQKNAGYVLPCVNRAEASVVLAA